MNKNKKSGPLIVGLTGQTGAGKSTVTEAFTKNGFVLLDCDAITRELQQKEEVLAALAAAFGSEILLEDGTLNRKMLAAKAFSEPKQTEKLNGIMIPLIKAELETRIAAAQTDGKRYILLDAPTLFESGVDKMCDRKVSVLASEAVRLQRILTRDGITEEQARMRMSAQQKDAYYTVRSDFILRNNGTKEELLKQGEDLAKSLTKTENQDWKTALTTLFAIVLIIVLITGLYTFIYRRLYPRYYTDTVTAYSQQYDLEESMLYAIIRTGGADSEEQMAEKFDLLITLRDGQNDYTLLAEYYAGKDAVDEWLQDESYSSDGVNLKLIPDEETRNFVDSVQQAQKIYDNIYKR